LTVVWTKRALVYLDEIGDHVARDSPEAAERVVTQLIDAGESLQSGPWRGRRVSVSARDDVRELVLGKYRVIYQVVPEILRIVSVVHNARR
jgi:plasmid stabilization system protein ParE